MKSRISIEVDFENNNQPYIRIMQCGSEDVRDQLLSSFCQQFGGSSWCQIKWQEPLDGRFMNDEQYKGDIVNRIHITPIKPEHLEEQAEIMMHQATMNRKDPHS